MKSQTAKKDLSNRQAFTADELHLVIPFSRRSVYRMISEDEFPPHDKKIGKRKVWSLETIKNWLAGR